MRSPVSWYGSKAAVADEIAGRLGEHTHYVEVFAGSAAVLFAKVPSKLETVNDVDGDIVNLFRVLGDAEASTELAARCNVTLYARAEFTEARSEIAAGPAPLTGSRDERVRRAWAFLVATNFSVSKAPTSTGWARAIVDPGGSTPATRWQATQRRLAAALDRLRGVQVECRDWHEVLEGYDRPGTVFYLDPPYHPERRAGGRYRHELTVADHQRLVGALLELEGRALLSGFRHPDYAPLEHAGWNVITLDAAATRRRGAQPGETLWVSPG